MALRELQAMQDAYELLSPLDPNAQQRVMAWLSAALADNNSAPATVDEPGAPVKPAEHAPAVPKVETTAPAVEPVAVTEPEVAVEPEPVAQPARDPRPKRARPARTTGRRSPRAVRSAPAAKPAETAPGRQGARPSGEQFLADLTAAGSFKALAEKYGKSIGTIGNWANQLREQGIDIPVGRQKKA
jgi:hypothetical protein